MKVKLSSDLTLKITKLDVTPQRALLAGYIENRGRDTTKVPQYARLQKDGPALVYGGDHDVKKGGKLPVVYASDSWGPWLRRLLSKKDRAGLLKDLRTVRDVPGELQRELPK